MGAADDYITREAQPSDASQLSALLSKEYYVHRHLDWRPPLEWLGYQPYWLLLHQRQLMGALACPADPPGVAWVRLFAATAQLTPSKTWRLLFPHIEQAYHGQDVSIAAISLTRWYSDLLEKNGFVHHQDIVVLGWNNERPPARPLPASLTLRPMQPADLQRVAEIDQASFEPLWQNSLEAVSLAFKQASSAVVAELDGQIAGFQISTSTPLVTHLARLAVHPNFQRQNIGYALVCNLFSFFRRHGSWQLTVNTQHDNHASLALYQAMGFELNGDQFPVYVYKS